MRFSCLLSLLPLVAAVPIDYVEHVVRCSYEDAQAPHLLREIDGVDVWGIQDKAVDIRLTSTFHEQLVKDFFGADACQTLISDLDALLKDNERSQQWIEMPEVNGRQVDEFFKNYHPFATLVSRMKEIAAKFPGFAEYTASIGKSFEGRDIPALKITNFKNTNPKKGIWWNSGQHAREWVAPATVFYQVDKLLTSNSTTVANYLDKFEFYVTPMQNPDGYEFSRTPGNRFWRKNRRKNSDGSYGVDLNRNWDEHWGVTGSSKNPRSDIYQGSAPASEPEIKAAQDYVLNIPNRYAGIDFHCYSQLVLRNWGWNYDDSKNEPILKKLGDGIAETIKKTSGMVYTSQKGADLYPASGAADDWLSGKAGIVGYTIELRDTGRYGFALPPQYIVPVGEEIWAAMQYFLNFLLENPQIPANQYTHSESN